MRRSFSTTMTVMMTPLLIATLGGCAFSSKETKEVEREKGAPVVMAPASGPVVMTPSPAPAAPAAGPDACRSGHVSGRTLAALR